jgi:hypothetical protein
MTTGQEEDAQQKAGEHNGIILWQWLMNHRQLGMAALLVILPPVFFYTILFHTAVNLPIIDDYEAILGFVNQSMHQKGILGQLGYLLTSQHNEYKLYVMQAVVWLQYRACGHIDFRILSAIGNSFVLLLGILLWKLFLPGHKELVSRLMYFVPVSLLLFQLQEAENLNWAASALQHVAVLFFAFSAIYLLAKGGWSQLVAALGLLALAIFSDGNGVLLIPIGLLILGMNRRWAGVTCWLAASAGSLLLYAHHYNVQSSQSRMHDSVFTTVTRLNPLFALSVIGSAGGVPFAAGSIVLGVALCIFFLNMARRGYYRRNPIISYCVLFLLLTAAGVAALRSDFGVAYSLHTRYMAYSSLLLIFAWFAVVEEFLQHRRAELFHNDLFLCSLLAAFAFSAFMDLYGWTQINGRNRKLEHSMAAFEDKSAPEDDGAPGPRSLLTDDRAIADAYNQQARAYLLEAMQNGIYQPPACKSGNAH